MLDARGEAFQPFSTPVRKRGSMWILGRADAPSQVPIALPVDALSLFLLQLAVGLGEIHAAQLAHNNVDLSNVLLVRDDNQASGVRCCWSGLSLAKKTDNHGNVRLSTEERLARLMRQDDYYQVKPTGTLGKNKLSRVRPALARLASGVLIP